MKSGTHNYNMYVINVDFALYSVGIWTTAYYTCTLLSDVMMYNACTIYVHVHVSTRTLFIHILVHCFQT